MAKNFDFAATQMDDPAPGVPRIVRRSPIARTPKLCPNCLSLLSPESGLGGCLIPQDYYCPKCGYRGYAYLEQEKRESSAEKPGE